MDIQSLEHGSIRDAAHRYCTAVPILRMFRCLLIATRDQRRDVASRRLDRGSFVKNQPVQRNGADFGDPLQSIRRGTSLVSAKS